MFGTMVGVVVGTVVLVGSCSVVFTGKLIVKGTGVTLTEVGSHVEQPDLPKLAEGAVQEFLDAILAKNFKAAERTNKSSAKITELFGECAVMGIRKIGKAKWIGGEERFFEVPVVVDLAIGERKFVGSYRAWVYQDKARWKIVLHEDSVKPCPSDRGRVVQPLASDAKTISLNRNICVQR
jgi:hypothetical protein